MLTEEEIVEERFNELFDEDLREYMEEQWGGDLTIADKRKAIRMKQDRVFELQMLVHHDQYLQSLDEDQFSEETRGQIQETKSILQLNKELKEWEYGLEWEEIEQMVVAGEFGKLKSARDMDGKSDVADGEGGTG